MNTLVRAIQISLAAVSALAAACAANAYSVIRNCCTRADVVVIATTRRAAPGGEIGTPDSGPAPGSTIELAVVKYIKGSGPATIQIPVCTAFLFQGRELRHTDLFDGTIGATGLWFLQRPNAKGEFKEAGSQKSTEGKWTASGYALGPLDMEGSTTNRIPLVTTECASWLSPVNTLADLFARNAAKRSDYSAVYLSLVSDLTPKELDEFQDIRTRATSEERASAAKEAAAEVKWLAETYPKIFAPKGDVERLQDLAIRLRWGQTELEDSFVQLYFALPGADLHMPMPPIAKMENGLIFAERDSPDKARGRFIGFSHAPKAYRRQVLAIAVKRIGQNHMLDEGILEGIAGLYDRKDLEPWDVRGDVPDDLTTKLDLVRELAAKELNPP